MVMEDSRHKMTKLIQSDELRSRGESLSSGVKVKVSFPSWVCQILFTLALAKSFHCGCNEVDIYKEDSTKVSTGIGIFYLEFLFFLYIRFVRFEVILYDDSVKTVKQ